MARTTLRLRRLALSLALGLPVLLSPRPALADEPASHLIAAGSLDDAIRSAGRAGAVWVAWEVPKVEHQGDVCCYEGWHGGHRPSKRGCRLEGRGSAGFTITSGTDWPAVPPDDGTLAIYAKVGPGGVERLQAYAGSCPVDAAGKKLTWLDGVDAERSVDFLSGLARRGDDDDHAVSALALHAAPRATRVLEELSRAPGEVREKAIFWLGEARGKDGFVALQRLRGTHPDTEVLEKIAFALSQSPVPEAKRELLDMAKNEPEGEARSKALFWLSQSGGDEAANAIFTASQHDKDADVRKQAVFALSQLDDGKGTPLLLRLLKETKDREVRQQALFWLGQSDDPKAQDALEAVLLH